MLSRPDRSSVVIIGCHVYDHLNDLPAVAGNLTSLSKALRHPATWGVPRDRITVLRQPRTAEGVLEAVEEAARRAEDTLVIYYAGHGLVDPLTGELHLALPGSRTGASRVSTALRFDDLRRVMLHHKIESGKTVLLVDCCYSGRALTGDMGTVAVDSPADLVEVEGTCVITASSETERALAPPGERFTAFTGELIRVLEHGVPGAGEVLDMDTLYRKVSSELRAKSRPVPQQRNRNTGSRICIARNRAAPAPDVPPDPPSPVPAASGGTSPGAVHPAEPGPGRARALRRRRWFRVTVVACVMAVVVGSLITVRSRPDICPDGIFALGPRYECLGVTDGSYVYDEHLEDVEMRIRAENARVAQTEEAYVSVAYMTSFPTSTGDDGVSRESVRQELEGAYLAQYQFNREGQEGVPKIRLVLANVGSSGQQWPYTVKQLAESQHADDRLVAVAGLGPSTSSTHRAVEHLSQEGLATVGAMPGYDTDSIPRHVGISPTAEDQAPAAAAYLKGQGMKTAMVVEDQAASHLYGSALGKAFTRAFPDRTHKLVAATEGYDSSQAGWKIELRWTVESLCSQQPEVVYFAGRGRHLALFLDRLADRYCQDHEFTVMAGDGAAGLTAQQVEEAAGKGIETLYTGLAHPDMRKQNPEAVSKQSAAHFQDGGTLDQWFSHEPRGDGHAIMAHDAVLTAAHGVLMAARWNGKVTGDSVGRMFLRMREGLAVPGAGGVISFQNDGDLNNKAIPILQPTGDGRVRLVKVVLPPEDRPKEAAGNG